MLINSPTPITERFYLLYTDDHQSYQRFTYTEKLLRKPTIQSEDKPIPTHILDELLTNKAIINPFITQLLPIEQLFWVEATPEMRRAAFYSYDYHHRNGNKKIPNVEITNWMEIPFFRSYLDSIYQNALPTNLIHPRTTVNAIIALVGKHQISVRMGHFHVTKDVICGKDIYGVHWDYSFATMSLSLIRHWLYDDMPS